MPREKESYRDNLERIIEVFPGKEILSVAEVVTFTGLNRGTVKKMFPFNEHNYISVATLASCMSPSAEDIRRMEKKEAVLRMYYTKGKTKLLKG